MKTGNIEALREEVETLRLRLAEAEETITSIHNGQVDGIVVNGPTGMQLYTLHSAAEPYRILIEEMNEGAATLSAGGNILYCNPRLAKLLQTPPEAVVGAPFSSFVPSFAQGDWSRLVDRARQQAATAELTLLAHDGRLLPVQVSFNRMPAESAAESCLVVTDLSERKKRETALLNLMEDLREAKAGLEHANEQLSREIREREQAESDLRHAHDRLRRFVDANIVGVLIANADGRVLEANDYFLRLIGYSRAELAEGAIDWRSLTPPEWQQADEKALDELIEKGVCAPYEKEYQRRDGSRVPVFLADAVLPDGPGEIAAFVIDITDRRKAEAEIRQLNASLEQRVADRTHELNRRIAEQQKTEAALRESEARLTTVMENLPVGIWVVDAMGKVIAKNKAADHIWRGTAPLSSRPEDYGEYVAWNVETGKRLEANDYPLAKTLQTGVPVGPIELRIRRFDDTEGFIMMSTVPLKGPDGALTGAVGINVDITGGKNAEAAVRESRERVELALRVARAFSFEWMVATDEVRRSTHCADILGISDNATRDTGKAYFQRVHPDDRQRFIETVTKISPAQPSYSVEYRIERSDGKVAILKESAIGTFDGPGRLVRLTGITVDVTAQVEAERTVTRLNRELRRHMNELQTIFDTVPVGLAIANDPEGRHIRGNPTIQKLVGIPGSGELSLSADTPPAYQARAEDGKVVPASDLPMQRACRGEIVDGWIMQIVRPDGSVSLLHSNATPLRDESGRPYGAVGGFLDITNLKRTEAELRKLTAELKDTNQELETFGYSVSHDLRAPLRSIDGFTRILLRDCAPILDEKSRENLQRVRTTTQRMDLLINDLLELSRTTRAPLHCAPVNLSAIAHASLDDLCREEPSRAVEIVIEPDLVVRADPGLMRASFDNLLGNAWKFTRDRQPARIEFGVTRQGDDRVYFVRDNGVGFDMAYAGKLFAPFQRLHSQADFSGTGIGLATVRRIIHRHGGRIWVEASPDKGATFFFTLGEASPKP